MKTPDGDRVIIPVEVMDELKNVDRETLSFSRANNDVCWASWSSKQEVDQCRQVLLGEYTGISERNLDAIDVVKTELTHNIGAVSVREFGGTVS